MNAAIQQIELVKLLADLEKDAVLESFPIIIGGGMIDDQICRYVGADHWVADAMSGVHLCQELMGDRPGG